MKKTLLLIAVVFTAVCVNAQGTWYSTGTEASIAAATDVPLDVTGVKCMHSDIAGVVGKSDTDAPSVSYNNVTYENKAYMQGGSNGMFYAFFTTKTGTLDVSIKMGSAKKTFVYEMNDTYFTGAGTTVGDLAKLTNDFGTADLIDASNYTLPTIYDTYNKTNGTWDGTVAIQTTGANVYMVMSIPVVANKTYVVGCFGSKLMLRGISLATTTSVNNISLDNGKVVSKEFYNVSGVKVNANYESLGNGIYIQKTIFENGQVATTKIRKVENR